MIVRCEWFEFMSFACLWSCNQQLLAGSQAWLFSYI